MLHGFIFLTISFLTLLPIHTYCCEREDIAIIGGGDTGIFSSLFLASLKRDDGTPFFNVHLFEKDTMLKNGASLMYARRHYGGEYPLDRHTAVQCLFSSLIYQQMFPTSAILTSREHNDFLLAKTSITTPGFSKPLSLEAVNEHYTHLQNVYRDVFNQISAIWGFDETKRRLFGDPEEFFTFLDSPEAISDERLRTHFAGGVHTHERGFNSIALGVILERLLEQKNVHVHLGCSITSADYAPDQGYKLQYVMNDRSSQEFIAKYVVGSAWHENPYLATMSNDGNPPSEAQRTTRVYLRSIGLFDVSKCTNIPMDRSYFGLFGVAGGMVSFYSPDVAAIYIPKRGLSLQDELELTFEREKSTFLSEQAQARLNELNEPTTKQSHILNGILEDAKTKYPFLENAIPITLVTRATVSLDNYVTQRSHVHPNWLLGEEKPWLAAESTKATFAPVTALQVLGEIAKKARIETHLSSNIRDFLRIILSLDLKTVLEPGCINSIGDLIKNFPKEFLLCEDLRTDDSRFLAEMQLYALKRKLPFAMMEHFRGMTSILPHEQIPMIDWIALEDVDLRSIQSTPATLTALSNAMESFPSHKVFRSFRLKYYDEDAKQKDAEVGARLLEILARIPINEFEIDQLSLTSEHEAGALCNLIVNSNLKNIILTRFSTNVTLYNALLSAFVGEISLEKARILFDGIPHFNTIRAFLNAFQRAQHLNELIFSNNYLGDAFSRKDEVRNFDYLVEFIERASVLKLFDLSNNGLFSHNRNRYKHRISDTLRSRPDLRVELHGNHFNPEEEIPRQHLLSQTSSTYTSSEDGSVELPPREWGTPLHTNPIRSNLPNRNSSFVESKTSKEGIESYLTLLWKKLRENGRITLTGTTSAKQYAVTGLGGVGKSELAKAYLHEALDNGFYYLAGWINCGANDVEALNNSYSLHELSAASKSSIINSCRQLLSHLGIPALEEETVESISRKLREALTRQPKPWLLVYDNVPSEQSIRTLLPQQAGGHVLITSRDWSGWKPKEKLNLNVFQEQESVQFLLDRSGLDDTEENYAAALEIAKELGHLPLALSQAASYIHKKGKSLKSYLKDFREHKDRVLAYGQGIDGYSGVVSTTWNITMEALDPMARKLMAYFSYLDINNIPISLFTSERIGDLESIESNVDDLTQYSMIQRSEDNISIHPLVQTVTQLAQRPNKANNLRELLALFTEESRRDQNFYLTDTTKASIERLRSLIPQALRLLSHTDELELEDRFVLGLRVSAFFNREHRYQEAIEILEKLRKSIKWNEVLSQRFDRAIRNNLINSYINMDDYEHVIEISCDDLPPLSKAVVQHCLSNFHIAEPFYKEAEAGFISQINEDGTNRNHKLNLALTYKNFGQLAFAKGDLDKSYEYLTKARSMYGHLFIDNRNEDMASTLAYLAKARAQHHSEEALSLYTEALGIFSDLYPQGNPEMLRCLIDYAETLDMLGKRRDATREYEKAIEIAKMLYKDRPYLSRARQPAAFRSLRDYARDSETWFHDGHSRDRRSFPFSGLGSISVGGGFSLSSASISSAFLGGGGIGWNTSIRAHTGYIRGFNEWERSFPHQNPYTYYPMSPEPEFLEQQSDEERKSELSNIDDRQFRSRTFEMFANASVELPDFLARSRKRTIDIIDF